MVRLRSSASHVPREAELKFQSQNSCGLRADKLQESLTIMRHFGLDLLLLQETWRLTTNDNDLWDHDDYLVVEHGLSVKRCKRGSLGLATVLNGRCRAAFERAGYQKTTFGDRIMALRLMFRDDRGQKLLFYVVNAYAPYDAGTSKSRRLLERYYDDLRDCLDARSAGEILVMATDANASMGIRPRDSDDETPRVVGPHGNPHTNWAGEQLRDFCAENELCSATTFFIKPRYNTWKNPRNCRGYQLDHFLVSQKDLKRVRDAGVSRKHSPALHSDHLAVYMRLRLARSLSRSSARATPHAWCNKERLRQQDVRAQFMATVLQEYSSCEAQLLSQEGDLSVDDAWHCYELALKTAEQRHLMEDTEDKSRPKGWFALKQDSLLSAIRSRNAAMSALMSCKGDSLAHASCRAALRHAASQVKMQVRLAQEEWLATRIAEVGSFRHPSIYWRAIKDLKAGLNHCKLVVPMRFSSSDDPSRLCSTAAENADRVKEHFEHVFNRPASFSLPQIDRVKQRPRDDALDVDPTEAEVRATIAACREAAPGADKLPPLYFKAIADLRLEDSREVFAIFMKILVRVWREGQLPHAWRVGNLSVLYKNKGAKKDLNNYRGLVLKAVAVKILGAVVNRRLQKIIQSEGLDEQFAYTAGRSSQHATFCLKTALQKRKEHGLPTWVCFVDLVKAFDSIPREALMAVLVKFGVPPRMLAVIADLHRDIVIRLKVADEKREFDSTTGVLQGATEAPALFVLYMQACLEVYDLDNPAPPLRFLYREDTVLTGRPSGACSLLGQKEVSLARTLFADDAALGWESRVDMDASLNCLFRTMTDFGILMHVGSEAQESKTVCMHIPPAEHAVLQPRSSVALGPTGKLLCARCSGSYFYRHVCQSPACYRLAQQQYLSQQAVRDPDLTAITVGPGTVPFVDKFKYLGTILNRSLTDIDDVKARVSAASQAFGSLKVNILTNKRLALKVRMNVFNTFILSVLLFGLEHWCLSAKARDCLVSFHRRCIRQILGISWRTMWQHRISQAHMERSAGALDIETLLLRRRLKWLGKLAAAPDSLPGKLLASWVPHPRPVGRPCKSLAHAYVQDLRHAGLASDDWRSSARDQPEAWLEIAASASGSTRTSRKALRRERAWRRQCLEVQDAWRFRQATVLQHRALVASTLLPAVLAARMHAAAMRNAASAPPPPPTASGQVPPALDQALDRAPAPPPPTRISRSGRTVVGNYRAFLKAGTSA